MRGNTSPVAQRIGIFGQDIQITLIDYAVNWDHPDLAGHKFVGDFVLS